MKKLLLTAGLFLLLFTTTVHSQSLSINTDGSTAAVSAMLDVKSTLKGILIPRMTRAERNAIASPPTGLLIFQNAPDSIGFYYYNGTAWTWMMANANADSLAWRTKGNTGTADAGNFIGTVDNIPLNVRVNNQRSGRIASSGETFYGYQAGNSNTSNVSTGIGYQALSSNTSGNDNTATGREALRSNTTGTGNTAIGAKTLHANTTAGKNTAIGSQALYTQSFNNSNTAWDSENIAIGDSVLYWNQPTAATNGYQNTAVGNRSLRSNTTGYQNAALGTFSLFNNTIGQLNTATGWGSLYKNTDGFYNTAVGAMAMYYNTTGGYNVGIGTVSLHNNLTGVGNTAVGQQAGLGTLGNSFSYNTILGYQSGYNLTTGSNNVFIGSQAGYNVTAASNKLYIANSGSTPLVYGDFSTGYVGMGTTSPSAKLHVGGGTRFTVLDTGSIFLQSGNTIGSARDWKIAVTLPNGYLSFRDMGYDNERTDAMATDAMVIAWGSGNVGIGTSTPISSKLEVNGYTKLGSGATVPAVQMKKITGTSPASPGAIIQIPHGLNWTKILAVDVLLDNSTSLLPPRYDNPAADYSFHVTSTDIVIYNGASMTTFSRPARILITYEQ